MILHILYSSFYIVIYSTMTKGSKKIAITLLAICAGLGATFVSHATDTSIMDALGGSIAVFSDTTITTTGITSTKADIMFPLFVKNNETIMNYNVTYSKKSLLDGGDIGDMKEVTFANETIKVENNNAKLTLEWLTPSTTYYFVVTPINKEGVKLDISTQVSFTTLASDPVATTTSTEEPMLWSANTDAANFTHTISGNKVVVTWEPIDGASKFTFATKESTGTTYSNVWSELVSKKTFTFVIPKIGLYSVKITPVDNDGKTVGAEKILTVKVTTVTDTPGKGTPATGPALNLVLMSTFLLMLVYVVYRFRTTK